MLGVLEVGTVGTDKEEKYVLSSSLTALLHPGHKASQRYLWSQLGHGGRRGSDRHWKPAERTEKEGGQKEEKARKSPRMYRRQLRVHPDTKKKPQKTQTHEAWKSKRSRQSWNPQSNQLTCQLMKFQIRLLHFQHFKTEKTANYRWIHLTVWSCSVKHKRDGEELSDVCECDEISHGLWGSPRPEDKERIMSDFCQSDKRLLMARREGRAAGWPRGGAVRPLGVEIDPLSERSLLNSPQTCCRFEQSSLNS